jgi:hypothetical protein
MPGERVSLEMNGWIRFRGGGGGAGWYGRSRWGCLLRLQASMNDECDDDADSYSGLLSEPDDNVCLPAFTRPTDWTGPAACIMHARLHSTHRTDRSILWVCKIYPAV